MNTKSLRESVTLFRVSDATYVSHKKLKEMLPTVEIALFFGKLYNLDYTQISNLLDLLFQTDIIQVMRGGGHSTELQDYLVDVVPTHLQPEDPPAAPLRAEDVPDSELLQQLFESAMVEVAQSIAEVGQKLTNVLNLMPSKEGSLVFKTMLKMNRNRPTVGVHQAAIKHARVPNVLVILDVSGSMTESTVRAILDDVMALTFNTNAHLATVSNNVHHWEPGAVNLHAVLDTSAFGGTHYEELAPLLNQDWETVVSIADYDSSTSAKRALANCTGRIGRVLDISLVNRPTFLGECLAQLADSVEPLMVGRGAYVMY